MLLNEEPLPPVHFGQQGWMSGAERKVIAYIPEMGEPELMYKLFDAVVGNLEDLLKSIG